MRGRGHKISWVILLFNCLICLPIGIAMAVYSLCLGEKIGRLQYGAVPCNPSQGYQQQKAYNCFLRVQAKTGHKFDTVNLYIVPTDDPNAYCFGRRSIALTQGALALDSRTCEALIAHELGHVQNGDPALSMVLLANLSALGFLLLLSNWMFCGILWFMMLCFGGRDVFSLVLADKVTSLIRKTTEFFDTITLKGLEAVIRAVERGEYKADQLAVELNLGLPLRMFLQRFDEPPSQPRRLREVLFDTHPPAYQRILKIDEAIQNLSLRR